MKPPFYGENWSFKPHFNHEHQGLPRLSPGMSWPAATYSVIDQSHAWFSWTSWLVLQAGLLPPWRCFFQDLKIAIPLGSWNWKNFTKHCGGSCLACETSVMGWMYFIVAWALLQYCSNSEVELPLQEEKLASSIKLHKDINSSTDIARKERQTFWTI